MSDNGNCPPEDIDHGQRADIALLKSEERLTFLLGLSDTLRPLSDPIEIQDVAARQLGEHLRVDRCAYGEIDGAGEVVTVHRDYHTEFLPSVVGQYRIENYGTATLEAIRRGDTFFIEDAQVDPRLAGADIQQAYIAMRVRSAVVMPLIKNGRFVALLTLQKMAPHAWTALELEIIADVADRTWASVERALADKALRDSEERQRALIDGVPQLVWRAGEPGRWTWAGSQWTQFTGQSEEQIQDWGWLEPVHPDDRDSVRAAWLTAREQGSFQAEYRIRSHETGAYRWFKTRAMPRRSDSGDVVEWLGTSTDVDDLRRARELRDTLLAELQHRVRNILALTRSIISRSDDDGRDKDDFIRHLHGRIGALARTQVLLTRTAGAQIDLHDLIRDELLVQVVSEEQFTLKGPDVRLSPKAAEVLTLAVHELATNATKYGAFSRDDGRVEIAWAIVDLEGQSWLALDWIESGVAIVNSAPRRSGFGTELISRRVPYELKGNGQFELRPGGLYGHIEFPLTAGASILQTDGAPL